MPEVAIVSITLLCVIMKTKIGNIIMTTVAAAATPARAKPALEIWDIA